MFRSVGLLTVWLLLLAVSSTLAVVLSRSVPPGLPGTITSIEQEGGTGGTALTVTEVDGNPSGTFNMLKFSSGSMTDNGDGSATVVTSGGGGDFFGPSSSADNEVVLFSGTTGKTGKRSALTAPVVKSTAGVQSAALAGTDYVVPGGQVATALALAGNGTNCGPGQAALGVDAAGGAEGCFDVTTQPELDTHAALTNPHSATTTNTPNRLVLRDSLGNFAAGTITAALSGNASTATTLATNGSNCPLGQAARGIDATGAAEDCTPVPSGAAIFATEVDGTPLGSFTTLKFSNGSVTDNGDGSATIVTGAGGGGDFFGPSSSADNEVVLFSGTGGKTGKRSTLTAAVVKSTAGVQTAAVAGTDYVVPGGTVATATALAANGTNCSAGLAPLGVDDLGNAEGCFNVATQTELDTHAALTTAHSATSANTASRIVLRDASGNFSAGIITASLTGNASTATGLAANGSNCPAGQAPLGIDASGNAEGCVAVASTAYVDSGVKALTNTALTRRGCTAGPLSPITLNADNLTGCDFVTIAALTGPTVFAVPSGTHVDGQYLTVLLTTAAAQTLTFTTGANGFAATLGQALPTLSAPGATVLYQFRWNAGTARWEYLAGSQTTTRGNAGEVMTSNGPLLEPSWQAAAGAAFAKTVIMMQSFGGL